MKPGQKQALAIVLLGVYAWFCYLMFRITWQYIPLDTDVAFLRIKQDHIDQFHYRLAFFVHVYTSLLVLPAAFTQFIPYFRKKMPRVHRWGGWLYATVVILLAGPSGCIIGIYANGGIWSQIAFCTLAVLWVIFTVMAIIKIRQRKYAEHQYFMIRSFALALSAITLRLWKVILVYLFHPGPMDVYRIIAWLGWVLNLVIAELIIYKLKNKRA